MDVLYSRIPNLADITAWFYRHRAKISGFLAGSLGTYVVTMFLVVAITGVPYDGVRLDPDRTIVYPNF